MWKEVWYMSGKTENHWGMLKDIWKIMWPAAIPLYLSYFYYRFVGVYTSGLLGQIMDLLLYRNGNLADSRLFLKLALAFLFSLLLMPSVDFLTNIVIFRKGLRYEASVVDRIFRKDYEAFGSCQSAEWAARVSSDPLTYRNMAILAPVRLLADGTVFLTALYASLQRDARLALLLTAGIWLSIALRFYDNIRKLRQLKHLSQEALGEILGVSGQAVSKWEQAITSPDISLLPALAGVFGVTIDSLFQDAIARRYPGYGSERSELVAFYTDENGTEKDFRLAAEALGEVILNGKASTEDYVNYGLLYHPSRGKAARRSRDG